MLLEHAAAAEQAEACRDEGVCGSTRRLTDVLSSSSAQQQHREVLQIH